MISLLMFCLLKAFLDWNGSGGESSFKMLTIKKTPCKRWMRMLMQPALGGWSCVAGCLKSRGSWLERETNQKNLLGGLQSCLCREVFCSRPWPRRTVILNPESRRTVTMTESAGVDFFFLSFLLRHQHLTSEMMTAPA